MSLSFVAVQYAFSASSNLACLSRANPRNMFLGEISWIMALDLIDHVYRLSAWERFLRLVVSWV